MFERPVYPAAALEELYAPQLAARKAVLIQEGDDFKLVQLEKLKPKDREMLANKLLPEVGASRGMPRPSMHACPSLLQSAPTPARLASSFLPCTLQGNGSRIDSGFEQQLSLHVPTV